MRHTTAHNTVRKTTLFTISASALALAGGALSSAYLPSTSAVQAATVSRSSAAFHTETQVLQAWNRAAVQTQPLAVVPKFKNEGSLFIAQVGSHVFLSGFVKPAGYALDLMLDHPLTDPRQAAEQLLPYWLMLIRASNSKLSEQAALKVVTSLGLLKSGWTVPNRFVVDARTVQANGVQYAVSYTSGITFSAEYGAAGTDKNRDLDYAYKQSTVLSSSVTPYPVSGIDERDYLQAPMPTQGASQASAGASGTSGAASVVQPLTLTSARVTGQTTKLASSLQSIAGWTANLVLATRADGRTAPVYSPAAVSVIKGNLQKYYTNAFIHHLLYDEVWANWVQGKVTDGALVEKRMTIYAQGRVYLVSEPPFQEGQSYQFVLPFYSDVTNRGLGSLSQFSSLPRSSVSSVKTSTVTSSAKSSQSKSSPGSSKSGNTGGELLVNVTVKVPDNGMGSGGGSATYTFHLVRASNSSYLIDGIDLPPMGGD